MRALQECWADKSKVLWVTWFVCLLWVFCFTICAIVAAAESNSGPFSFMAVWTMLISVGHAVAGTLVLKKFRSELTVGVFFGTTALLALIMLPMAALSGGHIGICLVGEANASETATAVFAVFLMLSYGTMAVFLYLFRYELIPGGPLADQDHPSSAQEGSYKYPTDAPPLEASHGDVEVDLGDRGDEPTVA